jgi:hypothetical protein
MLVARGACHWVPVRTTKKKAFMPRVPERAGYAHSRGWGGRSGSNGSMGRQSSSGTCQASS